MIVSSIIRHITGILNNITKTKINTIELIGGMKLYG